MKRRNYDILAMLGLLVVCIEISTPWLVAAQEAKLRNTFEGHTGLVTCVAFGPDGTVLASAGASSALPGSGKDFSVRLWDVVSGKNTAVCEGHTANVYSLAFTPDGKKVVSASGDKSIKLWDVGTGKALLTLRGHEAVVLSVAVSSDGSLLASGDDENVLVLWGLAGGKKVAELRAPANRDNPYKGICSVAFSPDSRILAAVSFDTTTTLWSVADRRPLATLMGGHKHGVYSVAFSPDGRTLALGNLGPRGKGGGGEGPGPPSPNGEIQLWEVLTGKIRATLKGHASSVCSVAFSPDGKTLASGSRDYTARLWDLATGTNIATLDAHAKHVLTVAFSPDGKLLASGSSDRTIKLWDLQPTRIKRKDVPL